MNALERRIEDYLGFPAGMFLALRDIIVPSTEGDLIDGETPLEP
jgi:hypothetical protein